MKNSGTLFITISAVLFFWLIGGFDWHMSWESRLIKVIAVGSLVGIAYWLKNSKNKRLKQGALVLTLLTAVGFFYAEPYVSHFITGQHYHYNYCSK